MGSKMSRNSDPIAHKLEFYCPRYCRGLSKSLFLSLGGFKQVLINSILTALMVMPYVTYRASRGSDENLSQSPSTEMAIIHEDRHV